MRNIIVVCLVLFCAVGLIIGEKLVMNSSKSDSKILKVAFPSKETITKYEPTNINLDYEYIFLENVFSPLVEMNKEGHIEPGVAEKMDWIGNELKLTIRPNLKTISGQKITTDDVMFSLKRLLVLSGNTHGNFKDIVCPGADLKSVDDECDGIRKDNQAVYIKAKGGKEFLLPMLSSIDFAIIPQSSVDPKTLKLINYSETSGVYSVSGQDSDGKINLKMNPNHYFTSDKIPQEIQFVPYNNMVAGDSLRMLKEGQVDHIMTIDQSRVDQILAFADDDNFDLHATMKIRTLHALFTQRGLKELSSEERRTIGLQLRKAFTESYKNIKGFEARSDFFPSLSEGSLTPEQKLELEKLNSQALTTISKKFKVGLLKKSNIEAWSNPIMEVLPTAECYRENNLPEFKKYEKPNDEPHVFIASTDTGFLEDISLISYALNAGLLGLTKSERAKWLAEYMADDNKSTRVKKLKKLHFQALTEPVLVPLIASPYTALVRKPWKMELSELFANNQLWRIKKQ
jgi:MarR-like DNA-binding transcriptional regulator SgrR of sgrS sRNA